MPDADKWNASCDGAAASETFSVSSDLAYAGSGSLYVAAGTRAVLSGRGLHSSTSQLNLSRF